MKSHLQIEPTIRFASHLTTSASVDSHLIANAHGKIEIFGGQVLKRKN